jgi:hypothetical protein
MLLFMLHTSTKVYLKIAAQKNFLQLSHQRRDTMPYSINFKSLTL